MNADTYDDAREACLDAAIAAFARAELQRQARKVIHQMQRIRAAGVYDDYSHRTLWDEYCHDVQTGPYGLLQEIWEQTIDGICAGVIDRIEVPVAALLSIYANLSLDEVGDEFKPGDIWTEGLMHCLEDAVSEIAAGRSMDRFDTGAW